ncbi:hypothetical protein ACQUSR_31175 [Streptomyces sp. P1-3]|uniref:phage tail protein n=1 Tax=Streptomyces sp. P1-3 TaxID=3421658 RepID=UPI003D35DEF1
MKAASEKSASRDHQDHHRSQPTAARTPDGPPARPPAVSGGAQALDHRDLRRLQGAVGNAAVSRLVAQRYTAPVKPPPAQDARFRKVKADVAAKKQKMAHHPPAANESKAAQDAAVAPPDDKEAQGKAANAEKMNAAKPGEFDKRAFIAAVNEAIAKQAPKNLDEADKFSESGKADKVKEQVDGKVSDGKDTSAKDIETTTKAEPDTSAAKEKQVTPMSPDRPPGNPGAPSAEDAIPEKQPPEVTDFSEGPKRTDKEMADAEVTEEQLAKGNEPQFDEALGEKKKAEAHSAKAPAEGRAAEQEQLAAAKAHAAASGEKAMASLTTTRATAGKAVDGGKGETKSKDEQQREKVTAKLQKVFDATKKDVEETLAGLDKKVDDQFTQGEKAARDAFTADHERRMKAYKKKRYSGFFGPAKWAKDKLAGMPEEANQLYQESRKLYVGQMQSVISGIADTIGAELGKAKARIAQGRKDLKAEVDKLPDDLKKFGEEAAKDFAGKFEDLESQVNDKSQELVQTLAQKYTEALNAVDEEIKKLQEANKGLVQKAVDAVVGAIKTIIELKNLLLGILAKAASAIGKIIKDPIGFLGNLVKAVGSGLNLFITNIADHLKKGLVAWLLGTATKAGIEIPEKFDLKGIIKLIASMLGLTWANIRARIVRKGVPDQAIEAVEQSLPVAQALAREGPSGAMEKIQEEAGDLKAKILDDLKSYLIPTVIVAGITWILSLLNPASAFVRAVKAIVDIVSFIVNQGAQIVQFVNAVLDAVIAIANGGAAGVPQMVETSLAASIPLLIGLLASLLGIGGLANKVKSVFHAVGRPVKRAIDKVVDFIVRKGKALWAKFRKKDPAHNKPGGKDGTEEITAPRKLVEPGSATLKNPSPKLAQEVEAVGGEHSIYSKSGDPAAVTKDILTHHKDAHYDKRSKTLTLPRVSMESKPETLSELGAQLGQQTGVSKVIVEKQKHSAILWGSINPRIRLATLANLDQDLAIVMLAVEKSGDVVKFLKDISSKGGSKTIAVNKGGIQGEMNLDLFEKAWNKQIDGKLKVRAWIKDQFRQVQKNHHEWIPSDLILDVTKQAATMAEEGPPLIDMQNDLRNETFCVVFNEKMGRPEIVEDHFVPNGHAGAVYFADPQPAKGQLLGKRSLYEEDFHNELRDAFNKSQTAKDAAKNALSVAKKWIWTGDPMSLPIHPKCLDRKRKKLEPGTQRDRYQEIMNMFSKHT